MMSYCFILWISIQATAFAADFTDLLRFSNGDQLHGSFQGMGEEGQILWKRNDVEAQVDFKSANLRHIVMRGGRPLRPLEEISHISLVNGDRIPGKIIELNDDIVGIETTFAGSLRIPRNQVAILAPNPLGGRMSYHGPFIAAEWKMSHPSLPDGFPRVAVPNESSEPGRWVFSGSAWYWTQRSSGTALILEDKMPDSSILKFDMTWKNRLSLAIGFHADFMKTRPEKDEEQFDPKQKLNRFVPGDSTVLPILFGNSYVMQIFSTHLMLLRTTVDGEGRPSVERIQINGNGIRLGESGKATIEIRCNRRSGTISLFLNDEFIVRWLEDGDPQKRNYAGKGAGFGFAVQAEDSAVKISDIMVAEWNGMPDAARSLQVEDHAIVLFANGTDRLAGEVTGLTDGEIKLVGKYGEFKIRLDEIAEIRFGRASLVAKTTPPAANMAVKFSPLGAISGIPRGGSRDHVRLSNPVYGDIEVRLDAAIMMDFKPSTNALDDWDVSF